MVYEELFGVQNTVQTKQMQERRVDIRNGMGTCGVLFMHFKRRIS